MPIHGEKQRMVLLAPFLFALCAFNFVSCASNDGTRFGRAQSDGWSMEVEIEIGRNPPIFDPKYDDVLNLGCTLQQTRGGKGKPPLAPGSTLIGTIHINDVLIANVNWPELHYLDGSQSTVLIAYLNLAIPLNDFPAPDTFNLSLTVETGAAYGQLTAWLPIFTEESSSELWESTFPTVPDSGPTATLLSEAAHSTRHWNLLRSLLFSTPFYVSKQELSVLRQVAPTFFGQNNDAQLLEHFPPEAFPERYSSCAIVGNAGHLRGSNLGAVIDAHEVVVRFNEAPTLEFSGDVGGRTTHRIVHASPPIRNFLQRRWAHAPGREVLVFFATGPQDVADMLHFQGVNNGGGVYLVSPSFVLAVRELLGLRSTDKSPTSGFVGLARALQVCDQVQTFGFGRFRADGERQQCAAAGDGSSSPSPLDCRPPRREEARSKAYRYFDSSDERPWAYGHRWTKEEEVHQRWHDMGLLARRF